MYKFENLTIFANKLESANFETKSEIGRGDCYTLIIFQSKVEFSYDGKEYFLIPPNSIILYTPMTMHAYKSCDNGFLNSFICFKIDSEYFKQFEFPFDTIFFANDETIKELVYIIDRISFIHNTDFELQNRSNIPNLLNTFFYTLNSAYLKTKYLNTSVKQNQLVFLDLRNKMIKDPVTYTVNRMTNEAGYTSTYFGICYKNYFGITPSHDRQQQLVKLIKRYLETTNMSLEQIAEACDIKSLSYLISLFKRFENTTPQKYRVLKQKHGNQKATPPPKNSTDLPIIKPKKRKKS